MEQDVGKMRPIVKIASLRASLTQMIMGEDGWHRMEKGESRKAVKKITIRWLSIENNVLRPKNQKAIVTCPLGKGRKGREQEQAIN